MTLSRRVARPMLASIFIAGGLDAFRNPEGKVKSAEKVIKPLSDAVPGFPSDTATVVKVNGAVQVGAGVMLSLGKFRRLSALALIGSIVPTTYAGHRFWEETDDATKAQQRIHFLKNLGLLGGLILALVDTEGAPSLSWRAKRRAHRLGDTVGSVVVATGALAHHGDGSTKAHRAAGATSAKAQSAGGKALKVKGRAAKRANKAAAKGQGAALKGVHDASVGAARLADAGTRAAKGAQVLAVKRGHDAAVTAGKLSATGGRAARKANKLAAKRALQAQQRATHLSKSGGRAAKRANQVAQGAAKSTAGVAKTTGDLAKTAAQAAKATAGDAAHTVSTGADRAGDVLAKVQDLLPVG